MTHEPTLVVLPSLGTTVGSWDFVIDALSARRPRLRVQRVELPGHGSGERAGDEFTIETLAADLVEHIMRLGVSEVIVAGVSMGGAIALEVARSEPPWLRGFVMLNSAARFGNDAVWAGLEQQVALHGTASLVEPSRLGWFATGFAASATEIVERLLGAQAAIDDDSYIRCCRALAAYDARSTVDTIAVPGLLIGASEDGATPPSALRELAETLPRADYIEVPDAGHLAIVEQPDLIAGHLDRFLHSVTNRPREPR